MEEQRFKSRIILGIDFTSRKKYRAEIERLNRELNLLNLMLTMANNAISACEHDLKIWRRERGSDGKFIKIEK